LTGAPGGTYRTTSHSFGPVSFVFGALALELEAFFSKKVCQAVLQSQEESRFSPFYLPYACDGSDQNSLTLFTRPSGS
jgi:hypothetical protein